MKTADFTHYLKTMAYHTSLIMTDTETETIRMSCHPDMPVVTIRCIRKTRDVEESVWPLGIWDHMAVDGEDVGNRCGARDRYTELAAPFILASVQA